jgi:cell division protein FtsQ
MSDSLPPQDPTSPSRRIPFPDVPAPTEPPPTTGVSGARERKTVIIGESDAVPGTGPRYESDYTSLTAQIVDPMLPAAGSASDTAGVLVESVPDSGALARPGADFTSPTTTVPERQNSSTDGTTRVVVIADDDGLPDASYTVTDARSPDDPGGPRVHPRLRSRRIAVRQRAGRRRVYWSAIAGGFLLIGLVAVGIFSTPLFAVNHIKLTGIVYTNQEQIAEITKSIRGKPILTADLNAVRDRLEELPWVKYATVNMDFPHTVVIQIAERTPVATYLGEDNQWRVIDVEGRVIDVLAGRPVDYVAIYGAGPMLGSGATSVELARVAQLVTAMPPQLQPIVKHFEVDQQFNVSLTLRINKRGDTQVDLCSAENLDVRQIVALTAFLNTKVNPKAVPPGRITACKPDLVTTSNS